MNCAILMAPLALPAGGSLISTLIWVLPLLLAVQAAVALSVLYNNLVTLRNECDRAWGNIDVLLKQRGDEVPNLVEVCRAYMIHERQTLEAVTEARRRASAAEGPVAAGAAGRQLDEALGRLFASVEAYPGLKADAHFLALQQRITGLESEIADRRELFNSTVTHYNIRIEKLPDAIVAGWLNYRRRPLLKFADLDRRRVISVSRPAA